MSALGKVEMSLFPHDNPSGSTLGGGYGQCWSDYDDDAGSRLIEAYPRCCGWDAQARTNGRTACGLTVRQIRRLVRRVQAEGAAGLISRCHGCPSNNRTSPDLVKQVLAIIGDRYADPTGT